MEDGLKIDSYEPFMIGLKFNQSIPIQSIEKKLKTSLQEMGFEVSNMTPSHESFIPMTEPFVETIGVKNGVEFKLNKESHAINIEGDSPEKVMEIFDEMPELFRKIKFEISESIIFYEIISNIIVETEKNPRQTINNSCKINLIPLTDLNTNVSGIKINSVDDDSKELIGLIIEPKAGNPNKNYFINLIYRSPTVDGINQFYKELTKKIIELLQSLED